MSFSGGSWRSTKEHLVENIWIESEKCWGEIVQHHATFSIVKFYKDGMYYEEIIENEDLISLSDMGINYESE